MNAVERQPDEYENGEINGPDKKVRTKGHNDKSLSGN